MTDKLIRMAGQIADFWRAQPGDAPRAVADHINRFWSYQMRADFLDALAADRAGDPAKSPPQHAPDPIVIAAAALIALPPR